MEDSYCTEMDKNPHCPIKGTHYWSVTCPGDLAFLERCNADFLTEIISFPLVDKQTQAWIKERIPLLRLQEAGEQ